MDAKRSKNGMDFFQDQMTQKAIIAGIAFVVGFGAAWLWSGKSDKGASYTGDAQDTSGDTQPIGTQDTDTKQNNPSSSSPLTSPSPLDKQLTVGLGGNEITVSDQAPGKSVMISAIKLQKDGWVAIHEDKNGKPGLIISAKPFKAGEYSNQKIDIFVDPKMTLEGKTYYAMLHSDNGKGDFDVKADTPVIDGSGQPVMMKFTVTSK